MEGQWIGQVSGTNAGAALLDLERRGQFLEGSAFVFDDDPELPGTFVTIKTDKVGQEAFEAKLEPLATSGVVLDRRVLAERFPDLAFPHIATLEMNLSSEGRLLVNWQSDIGTNGNATLFPSMADQPSNFTPIAAIQTWDDFKRFALDQEPYRHIYRGQSVTKRLRTTFHRTWRKDLVRFLGQDITQLHHAITPRIRHFFDLMNNMHNGAFWNLIQHHGYPTPLLDWSHSPFVAAFFAFRESRDSDRHGDMVRIFVFDRVAWVENHPPRPNVIYCPPHLSVLEALAIENPRALPQQAISTVTNVDDVEELIAAVERNNEGTFLRVIDLPYSSRGEVMRELELMGISAASLLPGLDGVCEQMKGRFFGY